MNTNSNCIETKNKILSFLKNNGVDNVELDKSLPVIDIFKLAKKLGFDIRKIAISNNQYGLLLVNENIEKIDGFDSNKVIVLRKDITAKESLEIATYELANYILKRINSKNQKIVIEELYDKSNNDKMINLISNILCNPLTYIDSEIKTYYESPSTNQKHTSVIKHGVYKKPNAKYRIYISPESRDYVNRIIKMAENENAKAIKYAHRYIAK